jgi:hypothetical protein
MDSDDDCNYLYQIQLLQAFNMHTFDEDDMSEKILQLYNHLKDCSQVIEIIEEGIKANSKVKLCSVIMFMTLFSYHFFDLFHKCLIDYFTIGSILEQSKHNIINIIKKD